MKIDSLDIVVAGPACESREEARAWLKDLDEDTPITLADTPDSLAIDYNKDGEFAYSSIVEVTGGTFYGKGILKIGEQFFPLVEAEGATITTAAIDSEDDVEAALEAIAGIEADDEKQQKIAAIQARREAEASP